MFYKATVVVNAAGHGLRFVPTLDAVMNHSTSNTSMQKSHKNNNEVIKQPKQDITTTHKLFMFHLITESVITRISYVLRK